MRDCRTPPPPRPGKPRGHTPQHSHRDRAAVNTVTEISTPSSKLGQGFGPAKLDSGSGVLEIILELAAVDPDLKGGGLGVNIAKHQEEIFSFEGQKNWTERTARLKLLFCKDIEHGGFLLHGAQTTKKVTGLDVVADGAEIEIFK